MDRTSEADPANVRSRLEPELRLNVHIARGATRGGYATKGRRIKVERPVNEIGMVQDIDGRALQFEGDAFRDPEPLDDTQVEVKVTRTVEAVDREIAKGAWSRSCHPTCFQRRRSSLTGGRINHYIKDVRVDKEHSGRVLEQTYVALELFEGMTIYELRSDVARRLVEGRSARGHVERHASRPGNDRADRESSHQPVNETV